MSETPNSDDIKVITLEEFITIPPSEIVLTVRSFRSKSLIGFTYFPVELFINHSDVNQTYSYEITALKTSDDYQSLYNNLQNMNKNLKLPEFPSKFKIRNRIEPRIHFFDHLVNTIIQYAKAEDEINSKNYLSMIYKFVIESTLKEHPKRLTITSPISNENLSSYFSNTNSEHEYANLNCLNNSFVSDNGNNSEGGNTSKDAINTSFNSNNSIKKDRHNSFISNILLDFEVLDTEFENSVNINIKNNKFYDWNNITVKLNDKEVRGYIKITEQCLFIYKHMTATNYIKVMPLYGINYDIYRIDYSKHRTKYIDKKEIYDLFESPDLNANDLSLIDFNSEIVFKLYHPFDYYDFTLKFPKSKKLLSVRNFIQILESNRIVGKTISAFMFPIEETNLNIYGKLELELSTLTINDHSGQCMIKTILHPYKFESAVIDSNSIFNFKQSMLIPIHNRFGKLTFEVYHIVMEGLLVKTSNKFKVFELTVDLPQVLNTYFFPPEMIELNMNRAIVKDKIKEIFGTLEAKLNIKIRDHSNMLCLTTKNRNKKILEDMLLNNDDDDLSFKTLLKRIKKMLIFTKDFMYTYKTLFRFKYPLFSSFLMISFILFFIFLDAKYIVGSILFVFIIILLSFSRVYRTYLSPFFDKYLFSVKHPYDTESVFIITVKEEDAKEVKKEDYLIAKDEGGLISNIIDPIKHFKEYKENYLSILFVLTNLVSSIEKLKNLFLWTDPLLSFYFLVILLGFYLIVYKIEIKYIFMFSFTKKFIIGMFYYYFKHQNNLEIGKIILSNCIKEWRNEHKVESLNENNYQDVKIFDDKFKIVIKENLLKHSGILIKDEIFNSITTVGDIITEMGRCKEVLKIKRASPLFQYTKNNSNILHKEIEPEDIFYYFFQNVKSDLYIIKNSTEKNNKKKKKEKEKDNKYGSLSNTTYVEKKEKKA